MTKTTYSVDALICTKPFFPKEQFDTQDKNFK